MDQSAVCTVRNVNGKLCSKPSVTGTAETAESSAKRYCQKHAGLASAAQS